LQNLLNPMFIKFVNDPSSDGILPDNRLSSNINLTQKQLLNYISIIHIAFVSLNITKLTQEDLFQIRQQPQL